MLGGTKSICTTHFGQAVALNTSRSSGMPRPQRRSCLLIHLAPPARLIPTFMNRSKAETLLN